MFHSLLIQLLCLYIVVKGFLIIWYIFCAVGAEGKTLICAKFYYYTFVCMYICFLHLLF